MKHLNTRNRPVPSALRDAGPETAEERETRNKEAFRRSLNTLLKIASEDMALADLLCKKVADHFGQRDGLRTMMMGRLRADAHGKKRGPKPNRIGDIVLLTEYHMLGKTERRPDVLELLAKMRGVTVRRIEKRITEARKRLSRDEKKEISGKYIHPT